MSELLVNLTWFESYSDEEIGRLFRAAARYAETGEDTLFDGAERFVWPLIKQSVDSGFCATCTDESGGNKTVTEIRFDTTDEVFRQNKTQNPGCISGEYTSFTQDMGCISFSETANSQNMGCKIRFDAMDDVASATTEKERDIPLERDIPPAPPIEKDILLEKERESLKRKKINKRKKDIDPQDLEDSFARFWKLYPRKVGKKTAKRAFENVMQSGVALETLVTALERQKCSEQWTRDGVRFVPHPTTWLNQERWEDETGGDADANRTECSRPFGSGNGCGGEGSRREWGIAKSPLESV